MSSRKNMFDHVDKLVTLLPYVDKHGFFGEPPPLYLPTWFMDNLLGCVLLSRHKVMKSEILNKIESYI